MACLPCQASIIIMKYFMKQSCRSISTTRMTFNSNDSDNRSQNQSLKVEATPNEIFRKEFPEYFTDGRFISRLGYVQFIDEALARMKELGLERNREAYKELLRIFPAGAYHSRNRFMLTGWQYFPQQLAAIRIIHQMSLNDVKIDKDFERLTVSIFSVKSEVWNKVARTNFWNLKLRNVDKYPVTENLPKEPHKLAKIGLERMLDDEQSIITTTNTSNLPDSIDQTWVVFSQSPTQKAIIEKLDDKALLYIEEGGLTWVDREFLSYYVLKYYVDPEVAKQRATPPKPNFDYETINMNFYGKPVREKLLDQEDKHYADGAYILGIGITGTSSQDSLSSWLKFLQQRNPKLQKLNVVFRMQHKAPEITEHITNSQENQDHGARGYN